MPASLKQFLKTTFYDPSHPAGFGGVKPLLRAAKRKGYFKATEAVIKHWLASQDVYTLHKQAPRRFKRNRVKVYGIDDLWQADLVDVSSLSRHNKGFKHILTVIDVLSKYAWAVPLKDKTGKTLTKAIESILKLGRCPAFLQSDDGTEFKNRNVSGLLKKYDVLFYTTNNETKASVVERLNRSIKSRMYKYFTHNNTLKYIDVLDSLLRSYNNAYHRSIRTAPAKVNASNDQFVWKVLYGKSADSSRPKYKFKEGDKVRVSKVKLKFEKGYLPNYSEEIFTVYKQHPRNPPVYTLKDYGGEIIEGTFYAAELQKVIKGRNELYKVEKVIRKRKRGGKLQYLVKWKGYPEKYNSWVDSLVDPKL